MKLTTITSQAEFDALYSNSFNEKNRDYIFADKIFKVEIKFAKIVNFIEFENCVF